MNLIIDVGNTITKVMSAINNSINSIGSYPTDNTEELGKILKNTYFNRAIISSVSTNNFVLKTIIKKHTKDIIILDNNTPLPITNNYKTPKTLGTDRIAVAIGATILHPDTPLLIIDSGTAITYDFVNNNIYYGGSISPGIELRYKALHFFTKKLPHLEPTQIDYVIGQNTQESIHSGVYNGIVYEINGIISAYKIKYPKIKCVITGGYAEIFVKKIKNTIFAEPYLMAIGLNRILNYNVEKN